MQRATVLMSGGIDSTACAHFLRSRGVKVDGLFVDHGQAAAQREDDAVRSICRRLSMPLQSIVLAGTGTHRSGELLGRNGMLLFTALFVTRGESSLLGLGIHGGTPYYDCSPAFIQSIHTLIAEHTDGRVSVVAPFLDWTKRDVYDYFQDAHLPLELTYSCEAGGDGRCGECASCRDRRALGC
jgi:7-cyano-7-deazaguanine synthase